MGWEQLLSAIWCIKKQGVTGQSVACKFKNLRLHSSRAEQITDHIAAFTGTTLLAIGHSIAIPGRSQQSGSTVFRKHTFHTRGTHYTQINPLLIPTLLNWTRFRKQKQNPLGRLEERQRSFSSKPKGPKHAHFSRPEVSHSRSLRNHIRSCLRGGRGRLEWKLFLLSPTRPSATARAAFWTETLLFWGEQPWIGPDGKLKWKWHIHRDVLPGGHTEGEGQVGDGLLCSPGVRGAESFQSNSKGFLLVVCFPFYFYFL